MSRSWDGVYLDGRSAARHPVTIQVMESGLQVARSGEPAVLWPYAAIRQTQGDYAGEQVRLEKGGEIPEVLVVADPAFGTALRDLVPHATGHIHDPARRRSRMRWTFLAGIGALGLATVLYLWGIPAFAWAVTPWVPASWEKRLGRTVIDQVVPTERRCKNPLLNETMQVMVAKLEAAAPENPYEITLIVSDSPLVNAFAVPGGYVVVFRGLIKAADRPEQVAGVLAHELQHLYQRHSTRMIIEHTSGGLLLGALVGDFSGAMAVGLEAAHTIGMLRYSRRHEQEADTKGMELLARAGIDPRGMVEFFSILSRKSPDLPAIMDYVGSHPSTRKRIAYLERLAATFPPTHERLGAGSAWEDLRGLCHSTAVPTDNAPAAPAPAG